MHIGLKWLMVVIALSSLLLAVAGYRFTKLETHRQSFSWVFVGMVVATTAVSILKHYSQHGCPWDLAMYGGNLPLFELFATPPAGAEGGRCFPAGHPSGGFALMAFYFAFIHSKSRLATNMLWLGLATGLLMGMAQVMRGAHFLSHALWSGWVVWVVLLILYWIWPPNKALPA
jgi:membrane-associated PAP2 superfamily phosphatase